jgi:glycosyl transferase family 25
MHIPVFVINLHDSFERMQLMRARLESLDIKFERFEAVDARKLTEEVIRERYPYAIDMFIRDGASGNLGCRLSHIEISKVISIRGVKAACVLEDDADLDANFSEWVSEETVYPSWAHIIKLQGSNKRRWVIGSQFGTINNRRLIFVPGTNTNGSAAYIVTADGAKRIVEQLPRTRRCGTDHALFTYELTGLKTLHVLPYPARQTGKSIIQDKSFKEEIKKIMYEDDVRPKTAVVNKNFSLYVSYYAGLPLKILNKRVKKSVQVFGSLVRARKIIGKRIFAIRVFRVQTVTNYKKV